MIFKESLLSVFDNTGVKLVKCIHFDGSRRKGAKIGSIILVSVQKSMPKVKLKKSEKAVHYKKGFISKGVIIHTKKFLNRKRSGDSSVKFNKNSVILLDKRLLPLGSRILVPVTREIRYLNFFKF